jgi:hypothetical protein
MTCKEYGWPFKKYVAKNKLTVLNNSDQFPKIKRILILFTTGDYSKEQIQI